MLKAEKERLDNGDVNILGYNNIKLNNINTKGELARIITERDGALLQLKRLNGGNDVALIDKVFAPQPLASNFDEWFDEASQYSPLLAFLQQEIEVSKKEVSLNKSLGWPALKAGYMSNNGVGQSSRGLTVGVSVPLWENRNKVKQAKTALVAAEYKKLDAKQQLYGQLNVQYNRVNGLKTVVDNYREALRTSNNARLLEKAYMAGQISMMQYVQELTLYYNFIEQTLDAER